eukprot:COSAG02_NODE_3624_length_6453_cov_7.466793_9_plen_96_part_00
MAMDKRKKKRTKVTGVSAAAAKKQRVASVARPTLAQQDRRGVRRCVRGSEPVLEDLRPLHAGALRLQGTLGQKWDIFLGRDAFVMLDMLRKPPAP